MSEENVTDTLTNADLKIHLANLYINRIGFSQVLQVLRDHCVKVANDDVEKADEETMDKIREQVSLFLESQKPKEQAAVEGPVSEVKPDNESTE